ncbi:MAG: DUF4912 domain-containing protein [Firmicutes bacterium]|nr:DUF4912 domain-containing protein [Bacillota bacterium]
MASPQTACFNCSASLPQFYGEDRLVILPRDPRNIFAYWEISLPTKEALEKTAGADKWPQAVFLLRVYKYAREDENNAKDFFDLKVGRENNSWYVGVTEADCFYRAELGWKLPGGSFQSIICSNLIRTPRDSLSDVIDENWQLPDWKSRKLFHRISLHHLSSPEFFRGRKK